MINGLIDSSCVSTLLTCTDWEEWIPEILNIYIYMIDDAFYVQQGAYIYPVKNLGQKSTRTFEFCTISYF